MGGRAGGKEIQNERERERKRVHGGEVLMEEISKKDLLMETGISYGQLYRWKREGLIPEEWFVKRPSFTGQETWFPRDRVIERIGMILEMKDDQSLDGIRRKIEGEGDSELEGLMREAVTEAAKEEKPTGIVIFETNDGKHYVVITKDGKAIADSGVKVMLALTDKEVRDRIKAIEKKVE
jgi:DNA-binding transcriptional MerR regulator